jgi:ketosteroid isomerase-like protein
MPDATSAFRAGAWASVLTGEPQFDTGGISMNDHLAVARRFYAGFAARDSAVMLATLHPEFVGQVSAGMPLGVGGRHDGPATMLREVWLPVLKAYDVSPEADRLLPCGPDELVAIGAYRGTTRGSNAPVDAAFAHVLRFREGRIDTLVQITDTASWPAPATR